MKTIDDVIQKLEYILEGDPRTFSNPECEYGWVFNRVNEAIKMLKEIEKDMPSAPQKMCGHWIDVNDSYNRISGKCSVCGWEAHMYEDDVVGMDYCPNCGADMRGEE